MSRNFLFLAAGFLDHPKFIRAVELGSSNAIHLWLGLMCYAKDNQTDGIVPRSMVARVNGPTARWRPKALRALVDAELVDITDDGVVVRDYLQWNFSLAEIKRRADQKKSRRPSPGDGSLTSLRTRSERSSERSSERVPSVAASVDPSVGANVERASLLSQPVSNDVVDLNAVRHAAGHDPGVPPASRARGRSGSGSGSGSEGSPPVVPPEDVPEPTSQTASTSSARGRRVETRGRTLCPIDFQPDATTLAKAASLGFSEKLEREEREDFIDWWRSAKRVKGDWNATYRNRLRAQAKVLGLQPRQPETQADREWRERKAAAEKSPAQIAPRARERLNAVKGAVGELFARS